MSEVTLESLIGQHELSGVDTGHIVNEDEWGADKCETLTFVLDGQTYTVTEDPSDGYRSHMRSLVLDSATVRNVFAPQKVLCVHRQISGDDDFPQKDDVLEMRDCVTGKVVLEIGTANTDDYYPYFVASFDPRNMACNQS